MIIRSVDVMGLNVGKLTVTLSPALTTIATPSDSSSWVTVI